MPYRRRPSSEPKRDRVPPVAAMRADEFRDMPFGGSSGEMLPIPGPQVTMQTTGLVIEPPDWEAERVERLERGEPSVTVEPGPSALERMMGTALERQEIPEPPPLGPIASYYTPLQRPVFPAPNWHEEQAQREREKSR
jgi:hypothetical protein